MMRGVGFEVVALDVEMGLEQFHAAGQAPDRDCSTAVSSRFGPTMLGLTPPASRQRMVSWPR